MAGNTKPIFVAVVNNKGTTWTNSDSAATKKTVFTAGSNGSLITALAATSSDTSDRVFNVYVNDGSTDFLIGAKTVSAGVGTGGATASVNFFADTTLFPFLGTDSSGRVSGLSLPTGWLLKLENVTQVTSAKTVTFAALGGDF